MSSTNQTTAPLMQGKSANTAPLHPQSVHSSSLSDLTNSLAARQVPCTTCAPPPLVAKQTAETSYVDPSLNWAGYVYCVGGVSAGACNNSNANSGVTGVFATWIVPDVASTSSSNEYSSTWIGIGGNNAGGDLVQMGTEEDVTPSGSKTFVTWWEILQTSGGSETPFTLSGGISPGDTIEAEVFYGGTNLVGNQIWNFFMEDLSTGASSNLPSETCYVSCTWIASTFSSADFIEEATTVGTISQLPAFTQTKFGNGQIFVGGSTTGFYLSPSLSNLVNVYIENPNYLPNVAVGISSSLGTGEFWANYLVSVGNCVVSQSCYSLSTYSIIYGQTLSANLQLYSVSSFLSSTDPAATTLAYGMSVRSSGGMVYGDPSHDVYGLSISSGTNSYTRQFSISSGELPGSYQVSLAIWHIPSGGSIGGAGSLQIATNGFSSSILTVNAVPQCNTPSAGNGQYNVQWCDYTGGNVGNAIVTNTWSGPNVAFNWDSGYVDNTGRTQWVYALAVGSFSFSSSGPWTLTTQHDDGLSVSIDGNQVYNVWNWIGAPDSITVPISAGTHTISIQYYAGNTPNLLTLTFTPPVTVTQTTTTTSTSTTSTLTSATSISGTTTTTTTTSTSTSVSGYACVVSTATTTSVSIIPQVATTTSSATSTSTTETSTTLVTTTSFTLTSTQTIVTVTTTSACTLSLTSTSITTTSSTTTQPGHVVIAIQLQPGWDLVSLPVVPLSTSITDLLKSQIASGEVVSVWSFQGSPPSWRSFVPGKSGSLTTMSDGYGYWIYMRTSDTLYVDGYVIVPSSTPPTYSLVQGWNLVGFKPQPTVQSETVGQYLSSITGSYDQNSVWVYDNTNGSWIRADPTYTLQPGQAMWILMTAPATLRP